MFYQSLMKILLSKEPCNLLGPERFDKWSENESWLHTKNQIKNIEVILKKPLLIHARIHRHTKWAINGFAVFCFSYSDIFYFIKRPSLEPFKKPITCKGRFKRVEFDRKSNKTDTGRGCGQKGDVTLQYVYINHFFFMSNFLSFLPGGALISLSATIKSYWEGTVAN